MTSRSRPFLLPYAFACLFALTAMIAFWYGLGRPIAIADASAPGEKLQCASYSPFDKDQSPFDQPFQLRPERIDADLALLAKRFDCVRTYSMTGLEDVPALARKHGLRLLMGAWVSADPVQTGAEIDALIRSANANRDVVDAVIVGNEVLLRKEATAAQLVALIERVRAGVEVPVTYADVWEFWLRHPEVAPAVDFLTIHLLPYWEDEPAGIEHALREVAEVRQVFGNSYAPKDILIGETGWPSEGRQRETAVPSRENQARFIREFVQLAEANGWRYNLIEAFDQPWKRASEGAVGGYWGLFDADRQDKGILTGPVSNLPTWPRWLAISTVAWLVTLVVAGQPTRRRSAIVLPLATAAGAACMGLWLELGVVTSRYLGEWFWTGALLMLNAVALAHVALMLGNDTLWRRRACAWLDRHAGLVLLATGFAGAVMALALVFDARYRSFPSAALFYPALVYLARPTIAPRRETTLLAALIAACIAPQLYQEGLENEQAIGWALVCVLVTLALWRSLHQSNRQIAIAATDSRNQTA
ncbi:glycoside hydrolase family 17 protein [Stutzerimonas chloritidismutans]|uniref:glycoside hydrolase family 17 protein n=1 Tax=Stutzerimonas chloritidismutans TaxID=203192 RepID=UPI003F148159